MIHARPLALLAAVQREADPVLARIEDPVTDAVGALAVIHGTLAGRPVLLATTGMGKANAACAVGILATSTPLAGIIGFGVAGAYPASGLAPGAVALASEAVYADEGVEVPDGWIGTREMGLPLLERGGRRWFNTFEVDEPRLRQAEAALEGAELTARTGRFLSVSACSGTEVSAARLSERHAGIIEDMESAAVAHISLRHDLPFLLVRGVSNRVGRRDRAAWRIDDAAAACARAVAVLVESWSEEQG